MTQAVSPEDAWETFRDHSYFDLWCVRRVGARKFGQGFHLMNGIEGKALCDLLNTRTPPPSALDEEEAIEAGVVALRDWMSENWGDIKDGAETGMRGAVRTLISLKDRGTD